MVNTKNEYEVKGDITVIFLQFQGRTLETVIDTADLEKVMLVNARWVAVKANLKKEKFYCYAAISKSGKQNKISLSRYLLDFPEGLVVNQRIGGHLDEDQTNDAPHERNGA